ncbi:L-tyrosine/L-tryptophan isonitrile synthase family protein, partial [Streptomyces mirabilis]|uniref:L-tyrosine/L-tryptophan isonitrile synthase family protein n=1 Tax=Streptomyces mirabilis TaxID=68239 RepID=UPI00367CDE75
MHTQPIGAPKFGIRLLDAPDAWTTPWHAVARCRTDGTWTLIAASSRSRIPRGGNARAQGPGWGLAGEAGGGGGCCFFWFLGGGPKTTVHPPRFD